MHNAIYRIGTPQNEPVRAYPPGDPARDQLKTCMASMAASEVEIPLVIGGREVRTGDTAPCVLPHEHGRRIGVYHRAGPEEVKQAVAAAREAWRDWSELPWAERVSVFLRAAELLSGPRRAMVNAAAMLGLSKTVHQAEIDAACELIDFYRFNAWFAEEIYSQQPLSTLGIWDRLEWRALEGFVFAVTPFNFVSIAGNLPTAPAIMGNTSIWKPASSAVYPAYHVMQVLQEAGLPAGVVNFLPGSGRAVGELLLESPDLAGIHFTGSTATLHTLWKSVGERIATYRTYPRIVGETGGKDFIFAHPSADVPALVTAFVRGAYEFQGQKCSAASRGYIPRSLWPRVKERLADTVAAIRMGDPQDFRNFMGAVIDEGAFGDITGFIERARQASAAEILVGGGSDASRGFFIEPTVIVAHDPHYETMEEEIFGPVLTLYVYPDEAYEETLALCDQTSPYGLTGAVFAQDRYAIQRAHEALRHAAGNFYVNDKPTGAVVGQQPFGGSRASGTNDKAGSVLNLLRWVTPRTIKETFVPPTLFTYPYMGAE